MSLVPYFLVVRASFGVSLKRELLRKVSFSNLTHPPTAPSTKLNDSASAKKSPENDRKSRTVQWLNERLKIDSKFSSSLRGGFTTLDVTVLDKRANWLKDRLALKDKEIGKMVQRNPNILSRIPESNMAPKLDLLQERLKWNDAALSKVIKTQPSILGFSLEDSIRPKLDFLQEKLRWDNTALSKVIKAQPSILCMNMEDNLKPKIEWIQQRLQLNATSTGKVIRKCPAILVLGTSENMEPKVDWLQKRLDLNDNQLSEIVCKSPKIFSLSIPDKIEPTLLWLQDRLCLSNKGLSRVLMGFPNLFNYNVNGNLAPTFEFYEQCIGTKGAQALLVSDLRLFGASLDRRLKPRLEEAKTLGFEVDSGMLNRMGKYTEDQWRRSVKYQR